MADYRKLEAWRRAHQLALAVYRQTEPFPRAERYGLTSQLRDAASSVPANIAEGYGRGTDPELARFCRISLGSLNELEYYLLLARDLGLLPDAEHGPLQSELEIVRRLLSAFVRKLVS